MFSILVLVECTSELLSSLEHPLTQGLFFNPCSGGMYF